MGLGGGVFTRALGKDPSFGSEFLGAAIQAYVYFWQKEEFAGCGYLKVDLGSRLEVAMCPDGWASPQNILMREAGGGLRAGLNRGVASEIVNRAHIV